MFGASFDIFLRNCVQRKLSDCLAIITLTTPLILACHNGPMTDGNVASSLSATSIALCGGTTSVHRGLRATGAGHDGKPPTRLVCRQKPIERNWRQRLDTVCVFE